MNIKKFSGKSSSGLLGQCGAAISEYLPIVGLVISLATVGFNQFGDTVREQGGGIASELGGQPAAFAIGGNSGGSTGDGSGSASGGSTAGGSGSATGGSTAGGSGSTTGGSTTGGTTGGGSGSTTSGSDTGGSSSGGSTDGGSTGGAIGGGSSGGSTGGDDDPSNGLVDDIIPNPIEEEEGSVVDDIIEFSSQLVSGLWEGVKTQFFDLLDFVLHPIETLGKFKDLAVAFYTDFDATLDAVIESLGEDLQGVVEGDPFTIGRLIGENISPSGLTSLVSKLKRLIPDIDVNTKRLDVGCSSFVAGTMVWTDQGMRPIESLKVGDLVYSRDDQTFEDELRPITATKSRDVDSYLELSTGYDTFGVTEEHPFYLQGKGWVEAENIKPSNVIAAAEGDILLRTRKWKRGPESVYNFTVEKTHTYFIGANKLWVHNDAPCDLFGPDVSVERKAVLVEQAIDLIPVEKRARFNDLIEATDGNGKLVNEHLHDAILTNPDLARAWNLADDAGYSDWGTTNRSIQNIQTGLEGLNRAIDNPNLSNLGLDSDKLTTLMAGNRTAGEKSIAFSDLGAGIDNLADSGVQFENVDRFIGELSTGGNFSAGAGWTLEYLIENPVEFTDAKIKFEAPTNGNHERITDAVVTIDGRDILYEFKSRRTLPPPDFAQQFIRDLNAPGVDDLNQIKWVFDGSKVNLADNKQALLDALEIGLGTDDEAKSIMRKLEIEFDEAGLGRQQLIDSIEDNFESLFIQG